MATIMCKILTDGDRVVLTPNNGIVMWLGEVERDLVEDKDLPEVLMDLVPVTESRMLLDGAYHGVVAWDPRADGPWHADGIVFMWKSLTAYAEHAAACRLNPVEPRACILRPVDREDVAESKPALMH